MLENTKLEVKENDKIILETYLGAAPRGGRSFIAAMQVWLKEKLFLKTEFKNQLKEIQKKKVMKNQNF